MAKESTEEKRLKIVQGVRYVQAENIPGVVRTYVVRGNKRVYIYVPEGTTDISESEFESLTKKDA